MACAPLPKDFRCDEPSFAGRPMKPELRSTSKLLEIAQDWGNELAPGKIKEVNATFYAFGSYLLHVLVTDATLVNEVAPHLCWPEFRGPLQRGIFKFTTEYMINWFKRTKWPN